MKLEVRLYGARNLKFASPQGVWEASCILSVDVVTHSIVLPKTQPKLKNTNPVWNRALQFEFDTLEEKHLNVIVMETSDSGLQTILGQIAIPLVDFASSVGQEVRSTYPLANGSDVDIGIWITGLLSGNPAANPASPAGLPLDDKSRLRFETVGPFQKKTDYAPQRDVQKFKPDDLKRLTPHLARGSFGVVFKGWARGITEMVVIKDMEIQNKHSIDEWQKEIKIMAQTKSQYIAEVYGYSNKEKTLTIVMEYFENGDLFGVLHKYPEKHPLSLIQRMRMARHCALGLQVMHQKKFMHRDIKSMNILVDVDYTCKLTDFGCSKLVGTDNNYLHTANTGTPLWMAPEVKKGEYGFASDIYSIGLVLYELFERKLPLYEQNTQVTSLPKQFQSAPVVLPCVQVNPTSRPTIEQVLVQLDKLVRRITEAVKQCLSPEDKQKLQEAVIERKKTLGDETGNPGEVEATALYQYLVKKPAHEADKLISMALATPAQKGSGDPNKQTPQQSQPTENAQAQVPPVPAQPLPSQLPPIAQERSGALTPPIRDEGVEQPIIDDGADDFGQPKTAAPRGGRGRTLAPGRPGPGARGLQNPGMVRGGGFRGPGMLAMNPGLNPNPGMNPNPNPGMNPNAGINPNPNSNGGMRGQGQAPLRGKGVGVVRSVTSPDVANAMGMKPPQQLNGGPGQQQPGALPAQPGALPAQHGALLGQQPGSALQPGGRANPLPGRGMPPPRGGPAPRGMAPRGGPMNMRGGAARGSPQAVEESERKATTLDSEGGQEATPPPLQRRRSCSDPSSVGGRPELKKAPSRPIAMIHLDDNNKGIEKNNVEEVV